MLRWKSLFIFWGVWAICITGVHFSCQWQISQLEKKWTSYRDKNLFNTLCSIQRQFNEMERASFQALESLVNETPIISEITYWNPNESSTSIFKHLIDFRFPDPLSNRGVAIYNHDLRCIAWRNCDFNPAPHLLDECLNGSRFSSVVKSGRDVFVVLCSFMPIPHPKLRESYIGVAVAFLPLDTHYPLSTRYIKSQSFAKKMLAQYDLKDIVVHYGHEPYFPSPVPDSMQGSFQNLNGRQLGSIALTSFSKEVTAQRISSRFESLEQGLCTIMSFVLCVFLWGKLVSSRRHAVFKCAGSLGLLWSIRALAWKLKFPMSLLPASFSQPDVFHSLVFGVFSDSLANLFLTAATFFLSALFFYLWMPGFTLPHRVLYRYLSIPIKAFFLLGFFMYISHFLHFSISSIVKHAHFSLFDFIDVLPSAEVVVIYLTISLLALSAVVFYLWIAKNFHGLLSPFIGAWRFLEGTIFFFGAVLVAMAVFPQPVFYLSTMAGVSLSSFIYSIRFPKRDELRFILVLAIVGLGVYPLLDQANDKKIRNLVADRAEEFQEQFARDTVELSLDIFDRDPEIVRAAREKKKDLAFLLWSKSPLSERLDNLDILVYAQSPDKDSTNGLDPEPFSQFSLNMPNPLWYHPLKERLDVQKRKLLQYLPGYGEGKNLLFYMGGVPLLTPKEERVGYIVIFTRYAQMAQSLPLPEVFLKKPPSPVPSLLIAYFDGKMMYDTNHPSLSRNLHLSDALVRRVQEEEQSSWVKETVDGRPYHNFYFPRIIKTQIKQGNESQLITKKNIGMLGYPSPSLFFRIFFFLQFFLVGSFFLLFPLLLYKLAHYLFSGKNFFFTFEQKILMSFLVISGVPVFIMGFLSQQKAVTQIWEGYSRSLTEYLQNAERTISEETFLPITPEETTVRMADDAFCRSWGERNRRMLNIYLSSPPFLLATNRTELFQTELLPKRISGKIFYQLMLLRKEICITLESLADYTFVVGYKALYSPIDRRQIVGAISIPMIYNQTEVEREIAEIIATTFTVYVGIFLLIMIAGIILAHQITRPIARIIQGIHRVSAGELDFDIPLYSRDELGQVVESFNRMTKDLKSSREKLVQAEKDAAWREMARQIAHEIKNPLTPMKLSAQHIERAYRDKAKNFDKILEKGISAIIDAIDSLSKTASSFSEFARFAKPILGNYEIQPILKECTDLFAHYEAQNVFLECEVEENLPLVKTDPHQIKRVFINLLTNAVQAIKASPGKIKVVCKREGKEKVVITLRDNGCGIPDSVKPHLYEPNFSTKSHGSGLGLAISKRAIDYMGGEILIESEEGRGTLVTLKLRASS